MDSLLQMLIQDALSPDRDGYEPAVGNLPAAVQLGDLLELSWKDITIFGFANKLDYYRQHIPEELLQQRLTETEQIEIVSALIAQLEMTPNRYDLLNVISKAPINVSRAPLLDFVARHGDRIEDEAAGQAFLR